MQLNVIKKMVNIGEEIKVVFIYITICFRVRREYTILFLLQGRNLKIFTIFIFKRCSCGYQGKEIQVLMDQSEPPVVSSLQVSNF